MTFDTQPSQRFIVNLKIIITFAKSYWNDAKSYWNDYSKIRRASIPKWVPAFILTDNRGEVPVREANCSYNYSL